MPIDSGDLAGMVITIVIVLGALFVFSRQQQSRQLAFLAE